MRYYVGYILLGLGYAGYLAYLFFAHGWVAAVQSVLTVAVSFLVLHFLFRWARR